MNKLKNMFVNLSINRYVLCQERLTTLGFLLITFRSKRDLLLILSKAISSSKPDCKPIFLTDALVLNIFWAACHGNIE